MKKKQETINFKNIFFTFFIIFTGSITVFAQQDTRTITGVIKDNTGELIIGATVQIQNTNKAAISDFDGNYSIKTKKGDILLFRYLGMKEQIVIVSDANTINIVLQPLVNSLDEVVIVGYGSAKKGDLTGAISTVKLANSEESRSTNVQELIQGKIAGVNVTNTNGTPGSALSVKIRGTNSLRSDNEPLYVVDGILLGSTAELEGSSLGSSNDFQIKQGESSLNINPLDIESVQILKDASATAIYGSRGANGVVIISTKKGKNGKLSINASANMTISTIGRTVDFLNPTDFTQMSNQGALLNGGAVRYGYYNNEIYVLKDIIPKNEEANFLTADSANLTPETIERLNLTPAKTVDWLDKISSPGISHSARVTAKGGSDNFKFFISGGFSDLEGVLPGSEQQVVDFRNKINITVNDKIDIQTILSGNYTKNKMNLASDGTGTRGLMNAIFSSVPFEGVFFTVDGEPRPSPSTWLSDYVDTTDNIQYISSIAANIKVFDFLKYTITLNNVSGNKQRVRFMTDQIGVGTVFGGVLGETNLTKSNFSIRHLLKYNTKFNGHFINGLLGFSTTKQRLTDKSFRGSGFSNFLLREKGLASASSIIHNPTRERPKDFISAFLRLNYTYKYKYLMTYTFRRDGVSVFDGDNKWDNFHSFSLGWKLHREKFLKSLKFSELKLRAGWGQTGNSSVRPFQTLGLYQENQGSGITGENVIGTVPSGLSNKDLRWEFTTQYNIGLDWGLFDERLTGIIDVYNKKTNRLLLNKPIAGSNGFTSYTANSGEIENKGLEFTLNADLIQTDNFNWSFGGNISFNRNKILDLGAEDTFGDGRTHFFGNSLGTNSFTEPVNIFLEGEALGLFWGLKTDGLYRTEADLEGAPRFGGSAAQLGDVRVIDLNDDGLIDSSDKQIIGDPNPDFTYGFSTEFSYKNFSLLANFNGSYGNEVFNAKLAQFAYGDKLRDTNVYKDAWLDSWTPDNIDAAYPRQGYNLTDSSDTFVEDASFLRLSSLTFSYDFPTEALSKTGIKSLRTYFTGNNLLLFTSYRGFDPEASSFAYDPTRLGIDWTSSPRPISFILGLNISI